MKLAKALMALAAASVLGISACGGGGGTVAPTASHTAAPSHTAQAGEPALMVVPGYDYTNLASAEAQARAFVQSDPQHLKSASAHAVQHDGTTVAAILQLQVQPQYADLPEVKQAILPGMARGMAGSGATVTTQTIHTEKVLVARSESAVVYGWFHGGAITAVSGPDAHVVEQFVEAYLKAAHPGSALGGR